MNKIKMKIPVPDQVFEISQNLGSEVYLVGGCVRDFVHSQHHGYPYAPKDFDLATNLSEQQIIALLSSDKRIRVHKKESVNTFGVVFVHCRGMDFEVAPFRADIGVGDGRHPVSVRPATLEEDAARRDFTINNLYYDFFGEWVLDFNGGVEDIKNGVVRTVGDAVFRFEEDKLRLLRMIRFHSRLNRGPLKLDSATLMAFRRFGEVRRHGISGERIMMEFVAGVKQSLNTEEYLSNLDSVGLLSQVFPCSKVRVVPGNIKNLGVLMSLMLEGNKDLGLWLNLLNWDSDTVSLVSFLQMARRMEDPVAVMKARSRLAFPVAEELRELCRHVADNLHIGHLAGYQMEKPSGEELMARGLVGPAIGKEQDRAALEAYRASYGAWVTDWVND